jgi:hypothetical protein
MGRRRGGSPAAQPGRVLRAAVLMRVMPAPQPWPMVEGKEDPAMRTLPLLAAALLAACAAPYSTHEAASIHAPVTYTCDDGMSLRVRFARDGAHVTLPSGEELFLPRQGADNYAGAQHQLTGAGETATWQAGRRVPIACRVRR